MGTNFNFVATKSTDEIYLGQDLLLCATDAIQGKAEANHTHTADDIVNVIATDSIATVSEVESYLGI